MPHLSRFCPGILLISLSGLLTGAAISAEPEGNTLARQIGATRGIVIVLGDSECRQSIQLARDTELIVYAQFREGRTTERARRAVDREGLLNTRVYVATGNLDRLYLADNIADAVVALGDAAAEIPESEVLRVLRPEGKALLGDKEVVKPWPAGAEDWSHVYHSPDNNPVSHDQIARAPYLTQFLAEPRYGPVPQAAVASAGRVFKAFGNVAFHDREEEYLDTLVAFNGYNGTMLWKRPLTPGIMVHRNTMIATPDVLYVGDDKSCKRLDTRTGRLIDEITPPESLAGGTFWKWMALEGDVLYAVIGEQELIDPVTKRHEEGHGWSWERISKGYNQEKNTWGYGKNVLAIDLKSRKMLWHHHEDEPIDTRATCMSNGRLFVFRFGSYLACLDTKDGKELWRRTKTDDPDLFATIGEELNRQSWQTNWRTVAYMKCSDKVVYLAGPQMSKLLAVSTEDGSILWQHAYDNFQLVLRDDALYAISGPWKNNVSKKMDPLTGRILAEFDIGRRACTRVTSSVDAVFTRALGGSMRFDVANARREWVSPMRPGCFDGVVIANGLLYWFPFVCDCQLTLYGLTCVGPAGDFDFAPKANDADRLETEDGADRVAMLPGSPADWTTFRANNQCTASTSATAVSSGRLLWRNAPKAKIKPKLTAPVTGGGLVFFAGSDGIVRAVDAVAGEEIWRAYTGGAIQFPPTIWKDRILVGSGDGWVYAFEAWTGRRLWRFRAAPAGRRIPVYGALLSTWPVASGVLVHDGVAYVAAGIVNYDGTYVYALDAETGRLKWQNNSSGHLDADSRSGVSVQGHLLIHGDRLYLAGGNAVSPAIYDIQTGKCLNSADQLSDCESNVPRGWELALIGDKVITYGRALYTDTRYPIYDQTVLSKILVASQPGHDVVWLDNNKVMCFPRLNRNDLNKCVTDAGDPRYRIRNWGEFKVPDEPVWQVDCPGSVALVSAANAVIVATHDELIVFNLSDGREFWRHKLPACPIEHGLAVDFEGRIIVSLENGQMLCFDSAAG